MSPPLLHAIQTYFSYLMLPAESLGSGLLRMCKGRRHACRMRLLETLQAHLGMEGTVTRRLEMSPHVLHAIKTWFSHLHATCMSSWF